MNPSEEKPAYFNVSARRAGAMILAVADRLKAFRPQIARSLPDFDLRNLDELESYAMAVADARPGGTKARTAEASEKKAVVRRLRRIRKQWLEQVRGMVQVGLVDRDALKKVNKGNSHRRLSADVLFLGMLLSCEDAQLPNTRPVTPAELAMVTEDAKALTSWVLQRTFGQPLDAVSVEERRRFTVLYRAYDEVRRAISYLRWHEGDAGEIAPGLTGSHLAAKRRSPRGSKKIDRANAGNASTPR